MSRVMKYTTPVQGDDSTSTEIFEVPAGHKYEVLGMAFQIGGSYVAFRAGAQHEMTNGWTTLPFFDTFGTGARNFARFNTFEEPYTAGDRLLGYWELQTGSTAEQAIMYCWYIDVSPV